MKRIKPSPALLVAVIALVAALVGTAIGGVAVTSLNKSERKQVKKIAKKQGNKQAKKQIKKQEPGLNVNSAKSADEAAAADNASAINGQTVVPINHRSNEVTNAGLASLNGITIRVSCDSSGTESIDAVTAIPGGEISAISNDASGTTNNASELVGESDDNFIPGDPFEAGPGSRFPSERQYTLTYSGPDDRNVTAVFVTEDGIGDSDCVVSGFAIG